MVGKFGSAHEIFFTFNNFKLFDQVFPNYRLRHLCAYLFCIVMELSCTLFIQEQCEFCKTYQAFGKLVPKNLFAPVIGAQTCIISIRAVSSLCTDPPPLRELRSLIIRPVILCELQSRSQRPRSFWSRNPWGRGCANCCPTSFRRQLLTAHRPGVALV